MSKGKSNHEREIRAVCPGCGRKLKPVPDSFRGRKGRCPRCSTVMRIDDVPKVLRLGKGVQPIEQTVFHGGPQPPSALDNDPEATRLASPETPPPDRDPDATRLAAPQAQPSASDPEATRLASPQAPSSDSEPDATRLASPSQPDHDPDATRLATPPTSDHDPDATRLAASQPAPSGEAASDATPPASFASASSGSHGGDDDAGSRAEDGLPLVWNPGDILLQTYRVDSILGQGAFGTVYKVRHLEWGVDMAVKTPNPEALDAHGAGIFTSEAHTWSELGLHPHVVSCYYVRTLGGAPRAFAEYVDGGSLQERIEAGGAESVEEQLDIAIQFAWGLAYAHAQGLVHQDVKPANLMLAADGRAKVTDFGLTRAKGASGPGEHIDAGGGRTVLVDGSGCTPAYAAPEQLAGGQVSRAADAWSFGVSVLAMFTGGARWRVGSAAPVVLEELLARPQAGRPAMPQKLAELLAELFVIEPEGRLRDMDQVAARLVKLYREQTGRAYPRTPPVSGQALAADSLNNRALSQLDLGAREQAVALLEEALRLQPHHPEATCNLGLLRWRAGEMDDMELVRQLEEVRSTHGASWTDELALGLVHLERGDCASAAAVLEAIQDQEAPEAAAAPMVREALEQARRLAPQTAPRTSAWKEWKTTGQHIYFTAAHDAAGERVILPVTDRPHAEVRAAADGRLLARLEAHEGNVLAVALSRDGSKALTGGADMAVKLWNVADGACLQTCSHDAKPFANNYAGIQAVAFHPAAPRFFSAGVDKTVREWDMQGGECLRRFEGLQAQPEAMDVSERAGVLAVAAMDGRVLVWDLESGELRFALQVSPQRLRCLRITPDGALLLAGGLDTRLTVVDLHSGRTLFQGQAGRHALLHIACSADSSMAANCSPSSPLRLWSLQRGRCLRTFFLEGAPGALERDGYGACFLQGEPCRIAELYSFKGEVVRGEWTWNPTPAPWLLCRISASESVSAAAAASRDALDEARAAWDRGDCVAALEHVARARSQPGHERDPEALALARRLALRLPRRALAGGWQVASVRAHGRQTMALAVTADGSGILAAGGDAPEPGGSALRLLDPASGACLREIGQGLRNVSGLVPMRDGRRLVILRQGAAAELLDMETGETLQVMQGKLSGFINAITLDPTQRLLFAAVNDTSLQSHYVRFWQPDSGRHLGLFQGGKAHIWSMCVSRDASRFALYTANGDIVVQPLAAGEKVRVVHPGPLRPRSMFFLPGGGQLAMFGDGQVAVLDLQSGAQLRQGRLQGVLEGIAVCTPDCRHMLLAGGQSIRLFDLQTMTERRSFEGHDERVTALTVSPDGDWFASGDYGGTVRIWALDWELEPREPADWDDAAEPWLHDFLHLQQLPAMPPPGEGPASEEAWKPAFTPSGRPAWTGEDFEGLLSSLQRAGLGWLRPEGVRSRLEAMAAPR